VTALLLLVLQLEPVFTRETTVTCYPACVRLERRWTDAKLCCELATGFEACAAQALPRHPRVREVRFGVCGGNS
jgi:hypothetical protein